MPRPFLTSLDTRRYAITQRILSGSTIREILTWLETDQGLTVSTATLKRRLTVWRQEDSLLIKSCGTDEAVEGAVLDYVRTHRSHNGRKTAMPTDDEIREALKDRWRLSRRQIKDVRLRHQIRRRRKMMRFKPGDDLVKAVLKRCGSVNPTIVTSASPSSISRFTTITSAATGGAGTGTSTNAIAHTNDEDGDNSDDEDDDEQASEDDVENETSQVPLRDFPKDDELAVDMRQLGFDTCEKEIRGIRQKYGIKHVCRGANRYGRFRAVLHDTPSPTANTDDEDIRGNTEVGLGDDNEEEVLDGHCSTTQVSKLVQDQHFTIVNLDSDAVSIIHRIAQPVSKLIYDHVGPGVRQVRDPSRVMDLAGELLKCLNVPACTVGSAYVSNHYIVPDGMFGIWVVPLLLHVESDRDGVEWSPSETGTVRNSHVEHYIDEEAVRVGQALYLTKPAAVHTRMTALVLSR